MTAATTAKTAMQIAMTNQKTKSIRVPSFDSLSGSQGMNSATAVATAAAKSPIATSLTIAPLRTGTEPTQRSNAMPSLATGSSWV